MEDKKARILIVDDEIDIVSTLKHFLSFKGYETEGAYNAQDALDILAKEKVDLVLLDLIMPGLSGEDAVRIIRNKYPNVKIIIVTAYADEGKKIFKEVHLEGLFIKPMRIEDLYYKLQEVIESKQIEKDKQGIRARLFLIKANLLFWEPCLEVYDFLKNYFYGLSKKGELYQIENVVNEQDMKNKLKAFKPDIFIVNMAVFNTDYLEPPFKFNGREFGVKETIVYNVSEDFINDNPQLKRLAQAIQLACLKNGLIEIKWVEI